MEKSVLNLKLKSIKYSYSVSKNRKFLFFPKQLIGQVTLDKNMIDKIFIYRIEKMDIDCDFHNPQAYVSYS